MTLDQTYNLLLSQKLIDGLKKRNIEAFYCETKEGAKMKALEMIRKGSVVSYGGSQTLKEIGLIDSLKNGDYEFLDPNGVESRERERVARAAFDSDYYLMSSNALTESGELVNIDGYGNRTASLIFGPKRVIMIVGLNKVEPNLDAAIQRAKTLASRKCLLLFKQDYGSFDELSNVAAASNGHLVITSMSTNKDRIKVILVGENLGF